MSKMIKCKTCNADIASSAKVCPSCGAKNKKPFYQQVWFWIIIGVLFFAIVSGAAGSADSGSSGGNGDGGSNGTVPTNSKFAGSCGINASAEMGSSIIGYPTITINIENITDKKISAIQFYFVPMDVYGEEISGWTAQNKLYTDTAIPAGTSNSVTYQFIEDSVKSGKLYVYSVYFEDGTEWGDKNATKSTILKNALVIDVDGES